LTERESHQVSKGVRSGEAEGVEGLGDGAATLAAGVLVALGLAGAGPPPVAHGYAEGEFLRLAAPVAGVLESLAVVRGRTVVAGEALFAIDRATAAAERDRLAAALDQARGQLADLGKGRRPEELAVIAAQKAVAEAALRQSTAELARQQTLTARSVSSAERLEAARAAFERDSARLAEAVAQLETARLPARADLIQAGASAVRMAEAALAQQERRLAELAPVAPTDALVEETYYNPGEWVPAGAPVVSLLPAARRKLVVFVPESLVGRLAPGHRLAVGCDGCPAGFNARIVTIASRAEYTPPVIYSIGSREKLVFRVELVPEGGPPLPVGLPVDVSLTP